MVKNKLILGTVQFGMEYGINNKDGKPSFEKVKEILDFAYNNGIRFLDTAEAYGDSQNVIGEYHKLCSKKFNVVTKFSPSRTDLPKKIVQRVIKNLKTLDVSFLYSYMFHSFNDYKTYFNSFKHDLIELKKSNLIKKIGVSLHSNNDLIKIIEEESVDLIQLPFNLLDNSSQREEILIKAKKKGIEIHTRSVFLQGLFFKEINQLYGNLEYFKEYLKILINIVPEGLMNNLALNYAFSKGYIDCILIGVDNIDQLKSNINCVKYQKTNNLFCKIDKIDVENKLMLNPVNWTK